MVLLIIGLVMCVAGVSLFAYGGFFSIARKGDFNLPLMIGGWSLNLVGGVLALIGLVQIVIQLVEGFQ